MFETGFAAIRQNVIGTAIWVTHADEVKAIYESIMPEAFLIRTFFWPMMKLFRNWGS